MALENQRVWFHVLELGRHKYFSGESVLERGGGKVGSVYRRHFITTSQTCLTVGSGGAGMFLFEGDAEGARASSLELHWGRAVPFAHRKPRRTSCFGMLTILGKWFCVFPQGRKRQLVDLC